MFRRGGGWTFREEIPLRWELRNDTQSLRLADGEVRGSARRLKSRVFVMRLEL